MKLTQHKILDSTNHLNPLAHALMWGGDALLYLTLCQTYESHSKKTARSANLSHAVILSVAKYPLKSFCYFWLLPKVESPYPLDSNPQSKVALIYLSDSRITLNSLTLGESMRLIFAQLTRFATFHTTFKGIQMQT